MRRNSLHPAFYIAAAALGVASCYPWQDADGARDTLSKGTELTDVQIKDKLAWFSCGKGDLFQTPFTATNAKGQKVDGVVCKGLFKGSTIRFD